jgi:uncharacterized integral membrane protein
VPNNVEAGTTVRIKGGRPVPRRSSRNSNVVVIVIVIILLALFLLRRTQQVGLRYSPPVSTRPR